jgi:hypothetical protein
MAFVNASLALFPLFSSENARPSWKAVIASFDLEVTGMSVIFAALAVCSLAFSPVPFLQAEKKNARMNTRRVDVFFIQSNFIDE